MRKKKNTLFIIFLLIASLGIGYAFLTTTLNIDGTTDVDSNSWNVYWDNIQVFPGSVSGSQVTQVPTIDASGTTLSYQIKLSKPGDYYELTVDAVNDGTLNAMIESISSKLNGTPITTLPNYFDYSIKYFDGEDIQENQYLKSNSREKYRMRVEFKKDISNSDLPSELQTLTIEFKVSYVQADNNATRVRNYLYLAPSNTLTFGSTIPNSIQTYETYCDVAHATNHQMFIAVTLNNNAINNSYTGLIYNGNVYYIQGGGATYNSATSSYNNDSIYYESNKALMTAIFGGYTCEEGISPDYTDYYCEDGDYEIYISKTGYVEITDDYTNNSNGAYCFVRENGDAECNNI